MVDALAPPEKPPGTEFSDDAPKTNPWEQDELGYAAFCKRLSKVVLGLSAPRGYVIGLHGTWGSGKSTALAFLQSFIKKHNDELPDGASALRVVDFRPWMVSGHEEPRIRLPEGAGRAPRDAGDGAAPRVAEPRPGPRTQSGRPIIEAAATLAVAAHPPAGAAAMAGSTIARRSMEAAIEGWLAEPSLQAAYDDLHAKLASSGLRMLVLVDDIDRLDRAEIRATMQMVKTVGRLPNVVYLLAYDRQIVWSALDEAAEVAAGRLGFAEKIVQQELELPRPSPGSLVGMLAAQLSFLPFVDAPSLRRQVIVERGVRRDIARLSQ